MAANNQEMKTSISNALLDMVIQGLSPAKKQCYFIKYGNKVQLMRSYFGTMAVLDRVTGGADITPVVVRAGDEFEVAMDGPNMVVQKVQLMRSYFGTMAVLDRVTGGADITPVVVRAGDEFEVAMDGPNMVVQKHETKFENLDNEIIAAYVVIKLANQTWLSKSMKQNSRI